MNMDWTNLRVDLVDKLQCGTEEHQHRGNFSHDSISCKQMTLSSTNLMIKGLMCSFTAEVSSGLREEQNCKSHTGAPDNANTFTCAPFTWPKSYSNYKSTLSNSQGLGGPQKQIFGQS